MLPYEAVIMSKAILIWRTTFLIKDSSVFGKNRLCQLSLKVSWVNLVRVSMYAIPLPRPMEGTKTMTK